MKRKSLGMIETWGIVAAISAADAGCKAAMVDLVGYELNSGRGNIKFVGDVAAVQAAVSAARAAAERVGQVLAVTVIARPDDQLDRVTIESPENVPRVEKERPVPKDDSGPKESVSDEATETGPMDDQASPQDENTEPLPQETEETKEDGAPDSGGDAKPPSKRKGGRKKGK